MLELARGCVSCTLNLDLLPLLERLGGRVVVHLDPALEPEAVCFALRGVDVRVEAVVTVVDRLAPLAPRRHRDTLDAAELLATIPASARRGRFDDGFGTVLHGQPPLEPAHGTAVVHFAERRPFHPMRLHCALDVLLDGVVRTRSRMWLASQPDVALWLESAGGGLNVGNLGPWLAAVDDWSEVPAERRAAAAAMWDPYYGDRSQELVVVTRSASAEEITAALRHALVTDEELALAGELEFADPFAEWHDEMEEL